jgi:hypothetical protein
MRRQRDSGTAMSKHDKRDAEIADLKKRLAKAKAQRDRVAHVVYEMEEDIENFIAGVDTGWRKRTLADAVDRLRRWVS